MTEVHSIPETFTTIQYVTKDGEKCTATKNNGIVTVVGDKNGVRQVPLNDFMKEFVKDLPKVDLARTPNKDTVQFSGQPKKTAEETPKTEVTEEAKEISEEKPNHLKKYLLTGAGVLAVVGTGLYFFGRGKWWSKAAKNLETKGQELVDDTRQTLRNGGKKDPVAETPKTETPKVETPKTETPVTEVSEQEVVVTGNPVKKQPEIKTPKSPIPQEEIGKLPKDLELDISKISQMGKSQLNGRVIIVKTDKGITRHYCLNADKTKIETVRDFNVLPNGQIDFAPFRTIRFDKQTGQPSKIINKIDGMEDVITDLKPEAPKVTPKIETPKSETPKPEAPKTETPKAEAPKTETGLRPKSPIPQEQIFEIPSDLELDVAKIIKNGRAEHSSTIYGKKYTVKSPDGKTDRVYNIVNGQEITHIAEYAPNSIAPFRSFDIRAGQVRAITDNTTGGMNKKFFKINIPSSGSEATPVSPGTIMAEAAKKHKIVKPKSEPVKAKPKNEKPAEPKPEPKKEEDFVKQQEELNRQQEAIQRQQEETNNIILTGAALADPAVAGASERIAEAAGAALKPKPIKIPKEALEELATDLKLKPSSVTEDGAQAAEELFGPKSGADDLFGPQADDLLAHNPAKPKGTNVADDVSDLAESPKLEFEETKFTTQEDEIDDIIRSIDPDGSLEADFNSHNFGMDEFDSTIDNMTSSIDDLSSGFDDFTEGFFG